MILGTNVWIKAEKGAIVYQGRVRPGDVCNPAPSMHCAEKFGERAWCGSQWDPNCCFSEQMPVNYSCKEYGKCHYECCQLNWIICGQNKGTRTCCDTNENCVDGVCKAKISNTNPHKGLSLSTIIFIVIVSCIGCFIVTFLVIRYILDIDILDRKKYEAIPDAANVNFVNIDPEGPILNTPDTNRNPPDLPTEYVNNAR